MGNRRFAQIDTSDDDDNLLISQVCRRSNNGVEKRKCKRMKLCEEEDEEEEEEDMRNQNNKRKAVEHLEEDVGKEKKNRTSETRKSADESEPEEDVEEEVQEEAKPIGDVIRVSGKGRGRRNHYKSFEYDGLTYELEDPVLLVPEEQNQKPYVAIIKDISQTWKGNMMVDGQWFYRPEEAEKKTGGNWQSRDTRELFYSFHRDEVPAESVMHKCVVHFIPLNKQIPKRKQHPGFIVQKVYDTEQRRLFKLTDKDYEDSKQHEIDLLVQKTMSRVGDLPDIEHEDHPSITANEDQLLKSKRLLRKKSIHMLDVSREDEAPGRNKADTPGSSASNASEYSAILKSFNVMMDADHRNRWLEKLLQAIQFMCHPSDGNERGTSDGRDPTVPAKTSSSKVNEDNYSNGEKNFLWPDSAVPVIVSLERAVHDALASDFQKYNQKMRQLVFNLKNNAHLARRLLNGELDASQVSSMTPTELKEGLTSDELASRQPEEQEPVQMTNARCKRCGEKQVRLIDIIQAGHGDRYQLECGACGNTWYASRDQAATLTIGVPSTDTKPVVESDDTEKQQLVSPGTQQQQQQNQDREALLKTSSTGPVPDAKHKPKSAEGVPDL
ncbi:unnamed protein product [Cuscuta campestris]|uniref:BAH domain-containing protein n=1 Tax=Cuscuta campestris TaxID=132261 RepID=A0A484NM59_9ASTE|nr:unnamed protein product [Cuscuta campestris]